MSAFGFLCRNTSSFRALDVRRCLHQCSMEEVPPTASGRERESARGYASSEGGNFTGMPKGVGIERHHSGKDDALSTSACLTSSTTSFRPVDESADRSVCTSSRSASSSGAPVHSIVCIKALTSSHSKESSRSCTLRSRSATSPTERFPKANGNN